MVDNDAKNPPSAANANDSVWHTYVKDIRPRDHKHDRILPVPDSPRRNAKQDRITGVVLQKRDWQGESFERWRHQQVSRLTVKQVKRKVIEGRIDLHGYTRAEGESALQRFFTWAQTSGLHFVLVIAGKGGVLKEMVPEWFHQHPEFVVSFNYAQPKDGGTGAFYVHVRKMQSS